MSELKKTNQDIDWIFFDVGGVILDDDEYENLRIDEIYRIVHIFDNRISKAQVIDAHPRVSAMVGNLNDNFLSFFITDPQKLYMARNMMAGSRQKLSETRGSVRPETSEVLSRLALRYKIGLIANQPVQIRRILEEAGIDEHIAHFKISEDHGLCKPDVRYFQAVLNENGTTPEKSIMIDDNIERGLLPAKHIGMTTVWFKNYERTETPAGQIDYTITSLKDLLKFL